MAAAKMNKEISFEAWQKKDKAQAEQARKKRQAVLKQLCEACGGYGSAACKRCYIEKTRND
jgi:hypothetical protein